MLSLNDIGSFLPFVYKFVGDQLSSNRRVVRKYFQIVGGLSTLLNSFMMRLLLQCLILLPFDSIVCVQQWLSSCITFSNLLKQKRLNIDSIKQHCKCEHVCCCCCCKLLHNLERNQSKNSTVFPIFYTQEDLSCSLLSVCVFVGFDCDLYPVCKFKLFVSTFKNIQKVKYV